MFKTTAQVLGGLVRALHFSLCYFARVERVIPRPGLQKVYHTVRAARTNAGPPSMTRAALRLIRRLVRNWASRWPDHVPHADLHHRDHLALGPRSDFAILMGVNASEVPHVMISQLPACRA